MMNTTFLGGEFLLAGRYRPEKLIGRGGMANVYLGTDIRLARTVAIKVLRPETAVDPDARYRFQKEAHAVSLMGHPSIVRVYDAGEENIPDISTETPIPFIVMEYINGKILRQLMDSGAFDPKVAVHVALGILDALDESHRAGIIHRDIKPGNVMVTQSGLVKVCDFGIAHAIEESTGDATTILGTAQYFSPEQAKAEAIDARSDLYSTAVVLFEMLTARPPFSGESSVSVAFQHVTQAPPLLSSIRPELSDELGSVISRGLSKDRAERFATARDFAVALRRVRSLYRPEGEPVPTAPPAGSAASAPRAAAPAASPKVSAAKPARIPDPVNPAKPVKPEKPVKPVKVSVPRTPRPPRAPAAQRVKSAAESFALFTSTSKDDPVSQLRPLLSSDAPPSRKLIKTAVGVGAGVLLVACLIAGLMVWVMTLPAQNTVTSQAIEIPQLTNVSATDAQSQLEGLGLKVAIIVETSDTVAEGDVIRTQPEAGIQVGEGEIISLYQSAGPKTGRSPDLSLMSLAKAKTTITEAGFTVGSITTTYSPSVAKGMVISSDPAGGTSLKPKDVINLTVSNGLVKVPDVVGKSLADANAALSASDVQLSVSVQTDMTCSGQTVKSQSLAPGEQPQRSPITIVYCAKA
ncbi:MAG: hypothetical protein RL431_136 [Actinomycetota bacterium]|jgi:serine/threonine-protein kinase